MGALVKAENSCPAPAPCLCTEALSKCRPACVGGKAGRNPQIARMVGEGPIGPPRGRPPFRCNERCLQRRHLNPEWEGDFSTDRRESGGCRRGRERAGEAVHIPHRGNCKCEAWATKRLQIPSRCWPQSQRAGPAGREAGRFHGRTGTSDLQGRFLGPTAH